jgi:hypothetical protein
MFGKRIVRENFRFSRKCSRKRIFRKHSRENTWNAKIFEKSFAKMFTKTKNVVNIFVKKFGIPIFAKIMDFLKNDN